MAAIARYLADKSALARLHEPTVAAILAPRIESGLVATCALFEFEVLWSTRSFSEFSAVRQDRWLGYEWLPIESADWIRSLDVQERLWDIGSIRSVPLPDLLSPPSRNDTAYRSCTTTPTTTRLPLSLGNRPSGSSQEDRSAESTGAKRSRGACGLQPTISLQLWSAGLHGPSPVDHDCLRSV